MPSFSKALGLIVVALVILWGGSWLFHLLPDDWNKQWWGFPLWLTCTGFVLGYVAWASSVIATDRWDGNIDAAVRAEISAGRR